MTTIAVRPGHYRADAIDTRFFQLIADGVGRMLGFGMVVVAVRDGDDLVVVVVGEGSELGTLPDGRPIPASKLLGARWRRTISTLKHKQDPARAERAGRVLASLKKSPPPASSAWPTSTSAASAPASRRP